ncbi:hypothetical protein HK101_003052 [Irineochytrium annulatum]|nr:hypothetical protein HK101_003052 [Irineochytrium annulatum]
MHSPPPPPLHADVKEGSEWDLFDEDWDAVIEQSLADHLQRNPIPDDDCVHDHFHFAASCRLGMPDVAVATARRLKERCRHLAVWDPIARGAWLAVKYGKYQLVLVLHRLFPDDVERFDFPGWVQAALDARDGPTLRVLISEYARWEVNDALGSLRDALQIGWEEGVEIVRDVIERRHGRRREWIERNAAAEDTDDELTLEERWEYGGVI